MLLFLIIAFITLPVIVSLYALVADAADEAKFRRDFEIR